MKRKIPKILGVALTVVLLASLMLAAIPVAASPGKLKWDAIPMPKIQVADVGDYVLTPDTNVGPIAVTPGGDTLFAAEVGNTTGVALDDCASACGPVLFKSTDSGYTWTVGTEDDAFRKVATAAETNAYVIVDIDVSPDYASDTTMFVATLDYVYQSVDAGRTFTQMSEAWTVGVEDITDLGVGLDSGGRPSIMVGTQTTDTGTYAGEVYVYCPATTGMGWKAQAISAADVLAVAFSPNFADDDGISAVTTTDTMTQIQFAYGCTKEGDCWGDSIGPGTFRTAGGNTIVSTRARIAYPDDFAVDSVTANICFVGISGDDSGDPHVATKDERAGDAYKVVLKPLASSATDLNVRGLISAFTPTTTSIWSIDVSGDAEAANIVVGTDKWDATEVNYYWLSYYSTDSGVTWKSAAKKSPTGGTCASFPASLSDADAATHVVMAPDFATSEVAYGSTSGDDTSAFSRTADGGGSWNQISLVDYTGTEGTYQVRFAAVSAATYHADKTMYMVTQAPKEERGAVWKTTNEGVNWERIWSYANPTISDSIKKVNITSDDTVFAVSYGDDKKIYRSSDNGATFPTVIIAKEVLTAHRIISPTTIYTGHAGGLFYYTTKSGTPWLDPEDSEISGSPMQISAKGEDTIAVGSDNGRLYISSDGCETFERVGLTDVGTGVVTFSFDSGYATNHLIYATSGYSQVPGGGMLRCEVDVDDPGSSEWEQIDDTSNSYATVSAYGVAMLPGGVLYAADTVAVEVDDVKGSMWRSVNPTADVDGIEPPYFIKKTRGLADGDKLGLVGAAVFPNTLICLNMRDVTTTNYYEQIVLFEDTLGSPVPLLSPDDEASGVGAILTGAAPAVTMSWEAVTGATSYQYQVAVDAEFKSKADDGYTTGQIKKVTDILSPGATYYWRIRVAQASDSTTVGAPLITPWSEVRSFSTILGAGPVRPMLVAPYGGLIHGGIDTPTKPAFQWTQVFRAAGYQLQVSEDATFATVLVDKTTGTETSWLSDQDLGYSATYFWRVKATGVVESPWSDVGSFTTMAKPVAPTPPVVVEPTPPAELVLPTPETPGYIWAIIAIGAVLVIAVIVLIVRTRRVV